jgi:hypothetical protein
MTSQPNKAPALPPPIERLLAEMAASDMSDVAERFRVAFLALETECSSNWHASQFMSALALVSEQRRPLFDRLRDITEIVEARGKIRVVIRREDVTE